MKQAYIVRGDTGDDGTFGTFLMDNLRLVSGELPWRNNQVNISSIPPGEYLCTPMRRFGAPAWRVHGVEGRTGIQIHLGNWCGDVSMGYRSNVQGCILLGMERKRMGNEDIVSRSREAVTRLGAHYDGRFMLHVIDLSTAG